MLSKYPVTRIIFFQEVGFVFLQFSFRSRFREPKTNFCLGSLRNWDHENQENCLIFFVSENISNFMLSGYTNVQRTVVDEVSIVVPRRSTSFG